ncbi:hypothetical protein BGZ80_000330 [Entomortierella chlamydospora]|uniref:Yeast cell wall synthesis Kre9/Knh1-like N-terminal domain-containing protein n=1 Tax=Entomortierella chlamydospora TaxID=101097 RepID=A0A9P6SYN1_9FUNG|nr:hypothetical protein BGZ80_000330 [Entomortierella chlamydospora]
MLRLAAAGIAANIERPTYDHTYVGSSLKRRDDSNGVSRHEKQGKGHSEHHVETHNGGPRKKHKDEDKKKNKSKNEGNNEEEGKEEDGDVGEEESDKSRKDGRDEKDGGDKEDGDGKSAVRMLPARMTRNNGNKAVEEAPKADTDPSITRDVASVWERNRAVHMSAWGPSPEPFYTKKFKAKSPVDISLMQGRPEVPREVSVLKSAVNESLHSFQWTVPTSVTTAKVNAIRISHDNDVDTYSHYFEVVKAGDSRSFKSNGGEPIMLPRKGDAPKPLNKGDIIKPAAPTNTLAAEKFDDAATPKTAVDGPVAADNAPVAAKPTVHTSAARDIQSANTLTFAMALFGAVYFL